MLNVADVILTVGDCSAGYRLIQNRKERTDSKYSIIKKISLSIEQTDWLNLG